MTTIYDDVEYIEIVNSMNENQDIGNPSNTDECQNKYKYQAENEDSVIKFIEYINQKKMFERLLQNTKYKIQNTK